METWVRTAGKKQGREIKVDFDALSQIEPNAAGIDIGASTHWSRYLPIATRSRSDHSARTQAIFTTWQVG